MHDSFALPATFLGAIRAGIVPVLVNTQLTQDDYAYMLADSRAAIAIVSAPLAVAFAPLLGRVSSFTRLIIDGGEQLELEVLCAAADGDQPAAVTRADDACFWLYSSGSTGPPKGTVHVHSSLRATAELYAQPILGINEKDLVFSAANCFCLRPGIPLSFPLSVGATTLLMAERPTPAAIFKRLVGQQPTIFYGVPTLYAALLASPALPPAGQVRLRRCTSAGEALPEDIGKRWREHFGLDILDGIGSTEMLHIFLSNRPGDVRPGTTGKAVPGYELRLVNDNGGDVKTGELGELQVKGPTAAMMYWNNPALSRSTVLGEWTRTGDKYRVDRMAITSMRTQRRYAQSRRNLRLPIEVEAALISHPRCSKQQLSAAPAAMG
jgi:benzoate-CoA ligase